MSLVSPSVANRSLGSGSDPSADYAGRLGRDADQKQRLLQGDGMFVIVSENSASPCVLRGTLTVFAIFDLACLFWVAFMALHTRVALCYLPLPANPARRPSTVWSKGRRLAQCLRLARIVPGRCSKAPRPISCAAPFSSARTLSSVASR